MFIKALCHFRFCRLWWKNHQVQIRKLTAISSQRRTSRLQVNLQYKNSLLGEEKVATLTVDKKEIKK